jgi:hypothetical protein
MQNGPAFIIAVVDAYNELVAISQCRTELFAVGRNTGDDPSPALPWHPFMKHRPEWKNQATYRQPAPSS